MANQDHLSILMQGVDVWNEWRKQRPEIRPDLSGAILSKADLRSINLKGANLYLVDFSEANLDEAQLSEARFGDMLGIMNRWPSGLHEYPSGLGIGVNLMKANLTGASLVKADLNGANLYLANLTNTNLTNANLTNANLREVDFRETDLSGTNLSEANLSEAHFNKARLYFADLIGADLSEADLSEVDLRETNFSKANLSKAHLYKANLIFANLHKANLSGSNLSNTNLSGANLSEADLTTTLLLEANLNGANLRMVNLSFANLSKADLRGADLIRADLSRTDLRGADLRGADLRGADLRGADLRRAILVETDFRGANLTSCLVYGISAWDVQLAGTTQNNLIVTPKDEPAITIDDLEMAQFINLLLDHKKLRNVLNATTERCVLLLGRFSDGGLEVLQAIAAKLREEHYLPIIFDFERPRNRDFTETVETLAGLSRFVIADLSGPSVPQELDAIVPRFKIPFVPIIEASRKPSAMVVDILGHPWVVRPPVTFATTEELLKQLPTKVIAPAEEKYQVRQKLLDELFNS